ncbi:MAG: hypothetical protein MK111_20920 [Crocosphaera sp.]|uniref:CU044_2847 family protein n=1 Tax=Crocosphaera sp. TaxID=2729996 RepID=UPI0025853D90|nr:CU044_2847 family protein [Crocosphaera sp.]MCH2247057.1 hypothetical protein [Crocosphaera sp.]
MNEKVKFVPVQLENKAIIKVEASSFDELIDETAGETGEVVEGEVSAVLDHLQEVKDAIQGIAKTVKSSLDEAKPSKASVQFGIELGYESGQLTAMIVKGQGKANLSITLEWDYQ